MRFPLFKKVWQNRLAPPKHTGVSDGFLRKKIEINEVHWSEQIKPQNKQKGMHVDLKQPRGDGERCVTPARAAAKDTSRYVTRTYTQAKT